MEHFNEPDPLQGLLAIAPDEDVSTQQSVQKALRKARRQVGVHDVLGLMLVNLWKVLAQIIAPLFLIKKTKLNNQHKGEQ